MTQEHPITPSPELVTQWSIAALGAKDWLGGYDLELIATQAARWGADQELEACCEWLDRNNQWARCDIDELRDGRRPKPLSLKERALQAWAAVETGTDDQTAMAVIRRALEQLDD